MAVSSVRAAIAKATVDHKVTSEEAREILHVASRTNGISKEERAVLEAAIKSPDFDDYSKDIIQRGIIRSTPSVAAPAAAKEKVTHLLKQHGLDALSGLKSINADKLSPELKNSLERFSAILNQNDGDTVADTARELKIGTEKYVVVNDSDGTKEMFGFFQKDGKEIARAQLIRTDEKITVQWQGIDGKPGAMLATYSNGGEKVPAQFKKDLHKFIKQHEDENKDLPGKDIKAKDMPTPIRQHYEFMERNTPDGVGADVMEFEGRKLYVLHDYSCVSSDLFYTAKGSRVATVVDGELE